MGLLGNLIKKAIGDGISKAVSGAVEDGVKAAIRPKVNEWSEKLTDAATKEVDASVNAISDAANALNETNAEIEKDPEAAKNLEEALGKLAEAAEKAGLMQEQNAAVIEDAVKNGLDVTYEAGNAAYFAAIVTKRFPGAEVKINVPLSEITADAPEKAKTVDVLVLKGGMAKAAILIVPKNSFNTLAISNTMAACEKSGVTAFRFMREFSNKEDYVAGRIGTVL